MYKFACSLVAAYGLIWGCVLIHAFSASPKANATVTTTDCTAGCSGLYTGYWYDTTWEDDMVDVYFTASCGGGTGTGCDWSVEGALFLQAPDGSWVYQYSKWLDFSLDCGYSQDFTDTFNFGPWNEGNYKVEIGVYPNSSQEVQGTLANGGVPLLCTSGQDVYWSHP